MRLQLLAACLLITVSAQATEAVIRVKVRARDTGIIPDITIANMHTFEVQPEPVPPSLRSTVDNMMKSSSFTVYTTSEVDAALQKTSTDLTTRHEQLVTTVEQKLQANEEKLRSDVLEAIDDLPKAILSQTAVEAIKEAILVQLRAEMQQLRADLENQINAHNPTE